MPLPPVRAGEVLRYARCQGAEEQVMALLESCVKEAGEMQARVCFARVPCRVEGAECRFGHFSVSSRDLAKNLQGCREAVLFAATLGMEMDRLIQKYQRLSPAKAMMLQALGAERIEAGCDAFCAALPGRPRFSPGYGDVPLSVQKDVFALLQCEKNLGLYLNDSLHMSPSKSVTAFVGLME